MSDYVTAVVKKTRDGYRIFPDFKVSGDVEDLMIRGGAFYAVWDPARGMWSRNEYDAHKTTNDILWDAYKEFRIKKGENVGIIGSSGSGKTTIVNLLLRNIDATKGTILINGIDIKEYTKESLRKIFAYVPQKTLLFKGSVKENIGFDNKYDLSELDKVMHTARLKDVVLKNKEGFNYELEQSGINLSGGQKQRISIARALLNGGECLIFDDSFSSIDYITDRKIRQSLAKNYQDKMTILITQRMGTVKDTNKIIVIEEGKVEAIGTYKELTHSSSVFKEFISSQKSEVKE